MKEYAKADNKITNQIASFSTAVYRYNKRRVEGADKSSDYDYKCYPYHDGSRAVGAPKGYQRYSQ